MTNNKVKITAKKIWVHFDKFRIGEKPDDHYYDVKNLLDFITDLAYKSSRSYAEMTQKLNEYMLDVADYIKSQSTGVQSCIGLVFKSKIEENEESVSCIVSVKWGTMKNTCTYFVDCQVYFNER